MRIRTTRQALCPGLALVLAVVGCTRDRSIEQLRIDPATVVSACSPESLVRFTGGLRVAEGGGTVTYRWVHSDGTPGRMEILHSTTTGDFTLSHEWSADGPFSGWARIDVLSPVSRSSETASFEVRCDAPDRVATRTPSGPMAIQTPTGHYLTAVNEGGLGGRSTALRTNATQAGPWETFTLEWIDQSQRLFALRTADGHYLTAVQGGGIGGPNDVTSPVHTDARVIGPWELWTLNFLPGGSQVTLRSANGHFLTAVNGGGVGGSNDPVATDGIEAGPWQRFRLVEPPPSVGRGR